jgi:hypothetical protein
MTEVSAFFLDIVAGYVLWDYEGPSRDPAHRRPVAEIVARRDMSHAGRVNGVLVDTQVR